ncbi:MAG TPA: sulfite exporter TauE/SafE family protein [Gammaproteobacteria bacterium]|nr:sulfite exporter TauE/SafE family protein [Gammaproteobacteria bacterium]
MLIDVSVLSAFLVGLLGGVHCFGMCGGIVGALTLGLPERSRRGAALAGYLLAYNAGRLISYTLAGALMGGVGWFAAHWSGLRLAQLGLQLLAGLFMIALGLYLGGWWRGLARIEAAAGGRVWQRLEPLGRRLMPVRSRGQALLLGLLWGWLPCGLVYSVLIWSVSTASPLRGGLLMLGFGLGTLPALLAMGAAAARLSRWIQDRRTRALAGALVILFGLLFVWQVLSAYRTAA